MTNRAFNVVQELRTHFGPHGTLPRSLLKGKGQASRELLHLTKEGFATREVWTTSTGHVQELFRLTDKGRKMRAQRT